ncbi:hypothetical protein B0F90DRAFT_573634 [Multifurca ochricompacta]|uniref:Secreted protein n=1 Tax=Multifurca ochricompacta TaxID=376703 RepID=A0AAD4M3F2_9AGAM|nr:hypothetical protein B0F90DRAFT_573634 [Multifurca ochricompacta]
MALVIWWLANELAIARMSQLSTRRFDHNSFSNLPWYGARGISQYDARRWKECCISHLVNRPRHPREHPHGRCSLSNDHHHLIREDFSSSPYLTSQHNSIRAIDVIQKLTSALLSA